MVRDRPNRKHKEVAMRESAVELAVGDSVRVAEHLLTVVDISGEEVTFRLDHFDDDALLAPAPQEAAPFRSSPR